MSVGLIDKLTHEVAGSGLVEPVHIISLGAGVQSSTMALMAALGEITPMPVASIFADTQAEPASVYKWLDWLETQLPFPVIRVTAGSLTEGTLKVRQRRDGTGGHVKNLIPAFILNPDGSKGMMGRSCTLDYKIQPVLKKIKEITGKRRGDNSIIATQWIGISLDEAHRMKPSRFPWVKHTWPLIDAGMKRHDCLRWMESHGYPEPPRSACLYCPFHSDNEWRRIKAQSEQEFQIACDYEARLQHAALQNVRLKGKPFLHSSCVPLSEVDFSTDEDRGQGMLWGNECEGMCGV
jgi:hypothetical protein